jgi:site-specific recombinase XerD
MMTTSERSTNMTELTKQNKTALPLEAALQYFLHDQEGCGLSSGTVAGYGTDVRQFIAWLRAINSSITRPDQLTEETIHDYRYHLTAGGWARGTRAHKLVALRRFLRYLEDEREVSTPLAESITMPNVGRWPGGAR